MPVTLVKCKWVDGVQVYEQESAAGAITFGVDDTGLDVKFFGATASAYMLWDESADSLIFSGASILAMGTSAKLVIPVKVSGSTTTGDLWLDTTDNKLHFYSGTAEAVVTSV